MSRGRVFRRPFVTVTRPPARCWRCGFGLAIEMVGPDRWQCRSRRCCDARQAAQAQVPA